jgi:HEAT repeat protein
MFGWLRTRLRPPLDSPEKLWIERRTSWLASVLGLQRLLGAEVMLPTPKAFPPNYAGTEADGRAVYGWVCRQMGVTPTQVDLAFVPDDRPDMANAGGLYVPGPRPQILVVESKLRDPVSLVATLAHEPAHELLLGGKLLRQEEWDHEYVTDLSLVFLGLGVFAANSVIRESYARAGGALVYRWSIGKHGYLSERMYGYALALFAWVRGEEAPGWATHLRPNVRSVFAKELRYLATTRDTQFRAERDNETDLPLQARVARRLPSLSSPSSGARLAALWDLKAMAITDAAGPDLVTKLAGLMRHTDPFVRADAAEVLGVLGPPAEAAVPELLDAVLREGNDPLRRAAVLAVGRIGRRTDLVLPVLLSVWKTEPAELGPTVVEALGMLGAAAAPALPQLTRWLAHPVGDSAARAALVLGGLGEAAAEAVPALVDALKSGEGDLPAAAAFALGRIGRAEERLLRLLRKAARSSDEDLSAAARGALDRLTTGNARPAP